MKFFSWSLWPRSLNPALCPWVYTPYPPQHLRAHHWRPRKFPRRLLSSLEKVAYRHSVTHTGWPQCQAGLSACYCSFSLSYKCRSCLKPFGPKLNVISQNRSWANTRCWSCKQTEPHHPTNDGCSIFRFPHLCLWIFLKKWVVFNLFTSVNDDFVF